MNFKVYLKNLSRKLYLNRLPKKRMGAGCLLFNDQGKLLILKPTYKDHWLLPGGVIETNESPRQACIREVKEETGIDCKLIKLICIDYVSDRQSNLESVQFVFWGGIVSDQTMITVPPPEISSYQFVELKRAILMLGINSQRRLQSCLPYLPSQVTVYLENGQPA
jgi:8-oxo-dGTP diphosphatase